MIDYKQIAASISSKVEPAVIQAVAEVESQGDGFLASGEPKILFEPHIFWRSLVKRNIDPNTYVKGNEDILYKNWKQGAYGSISSQPARQRKAMKINIDAALEAASYGRFQILGENWKSLGYNSIQEMAQDSKTDEGQIKMFVRYIKTNGLTKYLETKDFKNFALRYNGSSAEKNGYPKKMEDLYNKLH